MIKSSSLNVYVIGLVPSTEIVKSIPSEIEFVQLNCFFVKTNAERPFLFKSSLFLYKRTVATSFVGNPIIGPASFPELAVFICKNSFSSLFACITTWLPDSAVVATNVKSGLLFILATIS